MDNVRYRVFGRNEEYDLPAMRELIRHGEVTSLTDVASSESKQWRAAGFYPELQRYLSLAAQHANASAPAVAAVVATRQATSAVQMLVAVGLMVVGIFVGGFGLRDFYRGMASSRWPTVSANLIDSDLVQHTSRSRKGRRRTSYTARVLYSYNVDGRSYQSRRIAFGDEWFTSARRVIDEVRSASPLKARYDPSMPANAVLHTGATAGASLFALGGLLALAAGIGMLLAPAFAAKFGKRISEMSAIRLGRGATS